MEIESYMMISTMNLLVLRLPQRWFLTGYFLYGLNQFIDTLIDEIAGWYLLVSEEERSEVVCVYFNITGHKNLNWLIPNCAISHEYINFVFAKLLQGGGGQLIPPPGWQKHLEIGNDIYWRKLISLLYSHVMMQK